MDTLIPHSVYMGNNTDQRNVCVWTHITQCNLFLYVSVMGKCIEKYISSYSKVFNFEILKLLCFIGLLYDSVLISHIRAANQIYLNFLFSYTA